MNEGEGALARWEYLKLRDHLGKHYEPSGEVETFLNTETGRLHFVFDGITAYLLDDGAVVQRVTDEGTRVEAFKNGESVGTRVMRSGPDAGAPPPNPNAN